jgi:hypothetical protein
MLVAAAPNDELVKTTPHPFKSLQFFFKVAKVGPFSIFRRGVNSDRMFLRFKVINKIT